MMKRLLGVCFASVALLAGHASTAAAGCLYGYQEKPGNINAYREDRDRWFTSGGGQMTVTVIPDNGQLNVYFPQCGYTNSCTTYAASGSRVGPVIKNPNGYTVTYRFVCS